jgi:hypothetical protein
LLPTRPEGQKAAERATRRIWHTPTSRAAIALACFSILYCLLFYGLYLFVHKKNVFGGPFFDVIYRCGVMAYVMIVLVTAYSLRTRLFHGIAGKAQRWVWVHIWLGIAALALGLLHADYRFVLHDFCAQWSCLTDHFLGMPALYGLLFIALSGVVGRFIDQYQCRAIAYEASTNGVGIAKAIRSHLLEQEFVIERYCAGKSEAFKQYCGQAIQAIGTLPQPLPTLSAQEQADFQRVLPILLEYVHLTRSLMVQERARTILRTWRRIHMILVPLFLLILTYHAMLELLVNVLHLVNV